LQGFASEPSPTARVQKVLARANAGAHASNLQVPPIGAEASSKEMCDFSPSKRCQGTAQAARQTRFAASKTWLPTWMEGVLPRPGDMVKTLFGEACNYGRAAMQVHVLI